MINTIILAEPEKALAGQLITNLVTTGGFHVIARQEPVPFATLQQQLPQLTTEKDIVWVINQRLSDRVISARPHVPVLYQISSGSNTTLSLENHLSLKHHLNLKNQLYPHVELTIPASQLPGFCYGVQQAIQKRTS